MREKADPPSIIYLKTPMHKVSGIYFKFFIMYFTQFLVKLVYYAQYISFISKNIIYLFWIAGLVGTLIRI